MISAPDDLVPGDRDMAQWIENGVVLVPCGAGYVPAALTGTEYDDGEGSFNGVFSRMDLSSRSQRRTVRAALRDVRLWWPLGGAVNIPGSPVAVYAERLPQRQYVRCMNAKCWQVKVPWAWVTHATGGNARAGVLRFPQLVRGLFRPMYPATLAAALGKIKSGKKRAVALSPRLTVARADMPDNPRVRYVVYYRTNPAVALGGAASEEYPLGSYSEQLYNNILDELHEERFNERARA